MNLPAWVTWRNAEPGLALLLLVLVAQLDRLMGVSTDGQAFAVGAGIAVVLLVGAILLVPKRWAPDGAAGFAAAPAPAYVGWGVAYIVLGAVAPLAGIEHWGIGLGFIGLTYLGQGAYRYTRRAS